MVITTKGLFEVAIESWPEWDLYPQPLNSVRTATRISSLAQCHISFRLLPSSVVTFVYVYTYIYIVVHIDIVFYIYIVYIYTYIYSAKYQLGRIGPGNFLDFGPAGWSEMATHLRLCGKDKYFATHKNTK